MPELSDRLSGRASPRKRNINILWLFILRLLLGKIDEPTNSKPNQENAHFHEITSGVGEESIQDKARMTTTTEYSPCKPRKNSFEGSPCYFMSRYSSRYMFNQGQLAETSACYKRLPVLQTDMQRGVMLRNYHGRSPLFLVLRFVM